MSTTISGNIKDLGVDAISGAVIRFWLRGTAGNQPRVNGTALIAPSQGGVFYFDLVSDASGNISGTLYSTRDSAGTGDGDIEVGGSKQAVWYGMQAIVSGMSGPEVPVHAKSGATLNISNVTPITTSPVITAPTGDTTYLRLDGGNSPMTGPLAVPSGITAPLTGDVTSTGTSTFATQNSKVRNKIVYADQYSGADIGAKIQAAHDALPSTGGTIDARGFEGAQTWSSTVTLSKPCVLILGAATFTYTGSSQAILCTANNIYVKGCGFAGTIIKYAGTSNIQLIKFVNGSSGIAYIGVSDMSLQFTSGGHSSNHIYAVDPVGFDFNNLYLSVDGSTVSHNMTVQALKVEVVTPSLIPPRGNGRIANIIHSNGHDGSAGVGAVAIYLKGASGAGEALQQIILEGQADIESSGVGLQLEYASGVVQSGAWFISGHKTANIKLVNAQVNTFINTWLNFAVTENFNIDAGSSDNLIINPNFQTVTTLGTDSGIRTEVFGTAYPLRVVGQTNLPAGVGGTGLFMAAGFTSPVIGKVYVGDGSGWELDLAKRTGSADTTLFKFKDSGAMSLSSGKIDTYNAVATAGNGVPAIFGATSQKAESAADTNVLTFTPPAAAGQYRINFSMAVSAQNTATLGWTATWKDSNASAQAPTNLSLFTSGTAAPALTVTAATNGNYYGSIVVDVDASATAIVVKLTFTGTSFAAKVSASIERLQ